MKAPVVTSISWIAVAVSITPLIAMLVLNALWLSEYFPYVAAGLWLLVVNLARGVFTSHHRAGVKRIKLGDFAGAIPYFEKSYADMTRRAWVDKFRWVILGSSSRWCYREIALCNCAFCFGQIGDGPRMKEYYHRVLKDYPRNALAITALRIISAAEPNSPNKSLQPTATAVMPPADAGDHASRSRG
jgi:hypothetical protein